MKLGSWIVATHYRPQLLRAVLSHLHACQWPEGWDYEICLGVHEQDREAIAIGREMGAHISTTPSATPGGKRNAALIIANGDLSLSVDDDDFCAPNWPIYAASALEDGYLWSGTREYRRLDMRTGQVTRWHGRGAFDGRDLPPVGHMVSRSYRTEALRTVHGWNDVLMIGEISELRSRLLRRFGAACEIELSGDLADTTVYLQHDSNLVSDRPHVSAGQTVRHGPWVVTGEGSWTEAKNFPVIVANRLGLQE